MFKLNRRDIYYLAIFVLLSLHVVASETKASVLLKPPGWTSKNEKPATLDIMISNIIPNKGTIRVVVWNKKEHFLNKNIRPYRYFRFLAKKKNTGVRFTGLIPGENYSFEINTSRGKSIPRD